MAGPFVRVAYVHLQQQGTGSSRDPETAGGLHVPPAAEAMHNGALDPVPRVSMIAPRVRASIDRSQALHLARLVDPGGGRSKGAGQQTLDDHGLDALLDHPMLPGILLTENDVGVQPAVVFYVLVRQSLLEAGVANRGIADLLATLVLEFGRGDRSSRLSGVGPAEKYDYLVDLLEAALSSEGSRVYLVNSHLGNRALWMSGLWHRHVVSRLGESGVRYYEKMGASGYAEAAHTREAEALGVQTLLSDLSYAFPEARRALTLLSDRYLFPGR